MPLMQFIARCLHRGWSITVGAGIVSFASAFLPSPLLAQPSARESDQLVQLELGRLALLQARYPEALALLTPLLEPDPTCEAHYYRGVTCARMGDLPCAVSMMQAVLNSPVAMDYPGAVLELAAAYAQAGDDVNARRWLEHARQDPRLKEEADAQFVRLSRRAKFSVIEPLPVPRAEDVPKPGTSLLQRFGLQAQATLGIGLDSNPTGEVLTGEDFQAPTHPSETGPSCEENKPEPLHAELCNLTAGRWSLDASLTWLPFQTPLTIGYRLRQNAALTLPQVSSGHFFDLQKHLGRVELSVMPELTVTLQGEAVQATQAPAGYARSGELRVSRSWRGPHQKSTWLQGTLRCEVFRDLPVVWALADVSDLNTNLGSIYGMRYCMPVREGVLEDSVDSTLNPETLEDDCIAYAQVTDTERYCTARLSGSRLSLEVGQMHNSHFWRLTAGYQHTPAASGPSLTTTVGSSLPLGQHFLLLGALDAQVQWQHLTQTEATRETLPGPLSLQQVQVAPTLELRLGKSSSLPMTTSLRYSGTGAALYASTPATQSYGCTDACGYVIQLYSRHVVMMEVSYAFR